MSGTTWQGRRAMRISVRTGDDARRRGPLPRRDPQRPARRGAGMRLDRVRHPRPAWPHGGRDRGQQRHRLPGRACAGRARRPRRPGGARPRQGPGGRRARRDGHPGRAASGGAAPGPRRPGLRAGVRRGLRRAARPARQQRRRHGPAAPRPSTASKCSSARITSGTSRSPGCCSTACRAPRRACRHDRLRGPPHGAHPLRRPAGRTRATSAGWPTGSPSSPTCCSPPSCSAGRRRPASTC